MALQIQFTAEKLTNAINAFTFALQMQVGGRPICSISVYSCLLMAAYGFAGQSRRELAQILGIAEADFETVCAQLKKLDNELRGGGMLSTANSVWYRKGISMCPEYFDFVRQNFDGHVGELDGNAMRTFVRESTQGKIDARFEVSDDTALMLVACLYFKASWMKPFDPECTQTSTFRLFDGESVPCSLMRSTDEYLYYEDDRLQAVLLPYDRPAKQDPQPDWKAAFILPKDTTRQALLGTLISMTTSPLKWRDFTAAFSYEAIDMYIPRLELQDKVDLLSPLRNMGVIDATQPSLDFWARSPPEEMWLSKVSHCTYLQCNEAGTEIAAATSAECEDGISEEEPKEFRADHPFWFVVFDTARGTVLYSAFVENV